MKGNVPPNAQLLIITRGSGLSANQIAGSKVIEIFADKDHDGLLSCVKSLFIPLVS